jgi:hypothetical protein
VGSTFGGRSTLGRTFQNGEVSIFEDPTVLKMTRIPGSQVERHLNSKFVVDAGVSET